ncbi:MAG: hypothetical protein GY784_10355 [Gammaproteobacteria bacterium]|nr:hypothetical protein [Gammaproteobacteria bacterium]
MSRGKFYCWLTTVPTVNTLSSATKFIITQGSDVVSITWSDILKNINIISPPVQSHNIVEINSDNSPYQMTGMEDVLICHVTGDPIDVIYEPKADSVKAHGIRAVGGTVNLTSDAASIELDTLTSGQAVKSVYSGVADAWLSI